MLRDNGLYLGEIPRMGEEVKIYPKEIYGALRTLKNVAKVINA